MFCCYLSKTPATMSSTGYVNSITSNGICRIEFFHPQSNSLPALLLKQLTDAVNEAALNNDVKVVVLSGAGEKVFCAGASFDELAGITTEEEGVEFFSGFAHLINAMRNCPKFIIGRIQGKCAGGGVGLAAACDYAAAVVDASVKLSELAIGIGPFVVGPAVERKIGKSAFSLLAIDATNWQTARWAYEKGLFASIHETIESMDEAINKLALQLCISNPEAMAAIKKNFWDGTEEWNDLLMQRAAISGRLALSDFTRNAIESFKRNRPAK